MAVSERRIKNKRDGQCRLTGKPGNVYDVNIKYTDSEGKKCTYSKKGFNIKKDAIQHEAEMKIKLQNPTYTPLSVMRSKQTVKEYLEEWVENHGTNLRPSTFASYKGHIRNHIVPNIGSIKLNQLSPAMLDRMLQKLLDKGLSQSTVRYVQRILSVSLEAARKYRYIETNPARDIITKFGKSGRTPPPYNVKQVQQLLAMVAGTEWEMLVILAALYGLRMSEILGLRWKNVNLDGGTFDVIEQLPYGIPAGTKRLSELDVVIKNDGNLPPVKGKGNGDEADGRTLPITDITRIYFERQLALQERQKALAAASGHEYIDNDLVVAKPDGVPLRRDSTSANWGQLIRRSDMPYTRFHDLRHAAATNIHQLTGDFYTVGMILGHSLKGMGISLGISTNLEAVTAKYIDVRLDRKRIVLETYHNTLHPKSVENSQESLQVSIT